MTEQERLEKAMDYIGIGSASFAKAREILSEIGVTVSTIFECGENDTDIWLRSGINTVSTLAEKEITTSPSEVTGLVRYRGYEFHQSKLPVEREDRFA